MMAKQASDRGWRWAAFLLGTLWVSIGCTPATLSMFFMPFVDDKIPPRCKLGDGDEVTVCIVTNFAGLETRPEAVPADSELAEAVAQQLRMRAKANRDRIKVVPPSRTRSYHQASVEGRSLQDVGKHFEADYVIALEIQSMSLYQKNSYNELYRGNIEMLVRAIDVKEPAGEGTIFSDIYRCEYPGTGGPVAVSEMSMLQFRTRFMSKVAADVARYFVAYPREERISLE
jgi:hypothetical protein